MQEQIKFFSAVKIPNTGWRTVLKKIALVLMIPDLLLQIYLFLTIGSQAVTSTQVVVLVILIYYIFATPDAVWVHGACECSFGEDKMKLYYPNIAKRRNAKITALTITVRYSDITAFHRYAESLILKETGKPYSNIVLDCEYTAFLGKIKKAPRQIIGLQESEVLDFAVEDGKYEAFLTRLQQHTGKQLHFASHREKSTFVRK